LTYTLIEAFEISGLQIQSKSHLTPLAEYRNGGLLIDLGLLNVRKNVDIHKSYQPSHPLIVEWRAATITLLMELYQKYTQKDKQLSFAQFLQGGTWSLGRKLAYQLRVNGNPPLLLDSLGNVF
jgi:hypothetical protein